MCSQERWYFFGAIRRPSRRRCSLKVSTKPIRYRVRQIWLAIFRNLAPFTEYNASHILRNALRRTINDLGRMRALSAGDKVLAQRAYAAMLRMLADEIEGDYESADRCSLRGVCMAVPTTRELEK